MPGRIRPLPGNDMIYIILHHHHRGIACWPIRAERRPTIEEVTPPDMDRGLGDRIEIQGPFELEEL